MEFSKIILKSGKDQSLRRRHPWIFSGAIKKIKGTVNEGDLVEVYDNKDEFLAIGHYQIGSIAIRVLSFVKENIDAGFWRNKIEKALQLRLRIGLLQEGRNNIFRLIHAEGDELPGLIIDYYAGTAVVQMHSVGMFVAKDEIITALKEVLGDRLVAIYEKSKATLPYKADIEPEDGYILGANENNEMLEYGNKFVIDWETGQKTGFFIDQRENRKLLEFYSKDRKVLNMFGFTGGFSVYAMQGGASLVHSVDSSKPAIELTNQNIALNFSDTSRHEAFAVDAFEYLHNIDQKYDLIILDPPAFAKHNKVLHNALQGYKKLNMRAIEQIKPGGIIFTFSCSQVVSKENFRKSVFAAAANTGRSVRILHQLTQPADHPVNIYHPESEYLKGFVLYVE
ncbi:MAG: class I SAM-dependent rRNA methyltransferase [Bacteroidota bacterium]|nr:class I SAM-dependent rRNA methyltransferase [Bacteroidota bacterium]